MNDRDYDISLLNDLINYNRLRYLAFKNNLDFEVNSDFEKMLNARYHKSSRIKRRFIYLLTRYNYIWFCTFTFNDYYINKSPRTKRDLIKKCISSNDFKFILNIDYGDHTMREHYHCILATNQDIDIDNFFSENYPCFSKSILCKKGINDFNRLSKYIDKLVHHCLKATTKNQRVLYNFKGYDELLPTYRDKTIIYHLVYDKLFNVST